jgi:fatty acid desaturase
MEMRAAVSAPAAEESFDYRAHRLVADLHAPNARVYWSDLLITSAVGWVAFVYGVMASPFSAVQTAALVIASFALYRSLCFIHELTHLRKGAVAGLETVWNLIVGAPLLMPSFVYVGVHQYHHNLSTYGTDQDPEYLPFSSSHWMSIFFVLHSVTIPLALLARFAVLAPAALVIPGIRGWVVSHASSLSMNLAYRRKSTPDLVPRMRRWELAILALWAVTGLIAWNAGIGWRLLGCWYAVTALVSVVNTLRTLAAHRYEGSSEPRDRAAQLADSVDVPGTFWTALWAPVGLRYHALHHYFPGIPYHNLRAAHQRLVEGLPEEAPYRRVSSPSLIDSLRDLYRRGKATSKGAGPSPRQWRVSG